MDFEKVMGKRNLGDLLAPPLPVLRVSKKPSLIRVLLTYRYIDMGVKHLQLLA